DGWQPCSGPGGRLHVEWVATFSGLRRWRFHWEPVMKTTTLKSIADIKTGYTFRKAALSRASTDVLGLQISDVRHADVIDPATLMSIQWEGRGNPPVLKPGDVVMAAKGNENNAAVFLDHEQKVVPSSQFLILSVKNSKSVSPEFLCWLLNYPETQQKISELKAGTKIYSISKKALQQLEVSIPSREVQEKLVEIARLFEEEKRLTHALIKNREVMVQGMSKKLLSGEKK
ncbi:restriction endonuclease subunit S, partial [Marinobacter bryozoorum]|uniref:restriction endonuclease subunit S n=1 Tax=Marinobacter bryozoorum TaxID=256324 RepID=UPI002003DEA7